MKNYILVMDDTGFNHNENQDEFVRQEKNTFCTLLIPEEKFELASKFMNTMCKYLHTRFKTNEFHFCEMYNKKGNFENLSDKEFIALMETFIGFMVSQKIEVITQTYAEFTFNEYPELKEAIINQTLKPAQVKVNDKTISLALAIIKNKKRVEKELNGEIKTIYCDEGVRKPNTSLAMPFGDKSYQVEFKNSSETPIIQLADFCAWVLSREKQILQKDQTKLSYKDIEILKIFSLLAYNYTNIKTTHSNTADFKLHALQTLKTDRKKKGLPPLS